MGKKQAKSRRQGQETRNAFQASPGGQSRGEHRASQPASKNAQRAVKRHDELDDEMLEQQ